jgi:entry exclusion lipoprotein TrbK
MVRVVRMNSNQYRLKLLMATLLVAINSGCSNTEELPKQEVKLEVNDENCKLENIKKIDDKRAKEEFAGLCFRRGTFVSSEKKSW